MNRRLYGFQSVRREEAGHGDDRRPALRRPGDRPRLGRADGAFYPGPRGGQALAESLLGRFSPSGRLPVSFPQRPGQPPMYYNPKAGTVPWNYADSKEDPLFAFGDGMGYGRVQYRAFALLPRPCRKGRFPWAIRRCWNCVFGWKIPPRPEKPPCPCSLSPIWNRT